MEIKKTTRVQVKKDFNGQNVTFTYEHGETDAPAHIQANAYMMPAEQGGTTANINLIRQANGHVTSNTDGTKPMSELTPLIDAISADMETLQENYTNPSVLEGGAV
jgi:hypothetical protein